MVPLNAVDLSEGWDNLWSAINTGDFQQLMTMATMIGVLLLVGALFLTIWKKKRGGGGGGMAMVIVMVVIGALLAAPNFLFPLVLNIVDLVINTAARIIA